MKSTYNRIVQFIGEERAGLEAGESNYFYRVFGETEKYYEFLMLVWPRYKAISKRYIQANNELVAQIIAEPSGYHTETESEWEKQKLLRMCQMQLHLELESFFIFSNILLDRIAACTQYYFGKSSKQWGSFEAMKDCLEGYCLNKGIPAPSKRMIEVMRWLHKNVSDFRHLYIVHKHQKDSGVRLLFATACNANDDEAYLNVVIAYPQGNEQPFQSEKPRNILNNLNQFLEQWIEHLRSNRDKRNLSPNA